MLQLGMWCSKLTLTQYQPELHHWGKLTDQSKNHCDSSGDNMFVKVIKGKKEFFTIQV